MTAAELEPGTLLLGKYRVIRLLGKGAMGAVYEVVHLITQHARALKLLHRELHQMPGAFDRFLREASAAGRIGDPHIIETFDAGETEGGEPYLVMELLDGKPMSALLKEYPAGKFPVADAVDLVLQTCEGVGAAHAAGIVHRDLKPDNLFVGQRDGRPFVKILDFGISKFEGDLERLTATGALMGTPLYMPPEQLSGKTVDARADVYALGVILYRALAGRTPFKAQSMMELAIQVHEGSYPALRALRPDASAELEAVIARCLAKDPSERFATCGELAAALRAAPTGGIADDPTAAKGSVPPPSMIPTAAADGRTAGPSLPALLPEAVPPKPVRSGRGALWGGVAAVALLGGAAAAFLGGRPAPVAPTPGGQATSAPSAAQTSPPVAAPTVVPAPGATTAEPAAPASGAATAPAPASSAGPPPAAPAPKPPATSPTPEKTAKPKTTGLATENPYQ